VQVFTRAARATPSAVSSKALQAGGNARHGRSSFCAESSRLEWPHAAPPRSSLASVRSRMPWPCRGPLGTQASNQAGAAVTLAGISVNVWFSICEADSPSGTACACECTHDSPAGDRARARAEGLILTIDRDARVGTRVNTRIMHAGTREALAQARMHVYVQAQLWTSGSSRSVWPTLLARQSGIKSHTY
jgi:hypothetical protein